MAASFRDGPTPWPDEKKIWQVRYRSIVDSESHLYRNGIRIIKFFLHLSREKQCQRFIDRIDNPDKNWKFSASQRKAGTRFRKRHAFQDCSCRDGCPMVDPDDLRVPRPLRA